MAVTPKNALVILNNNHVTKNSVPLRNNNLAHSRRLDRGATSNSEIYATVRVSARGGLIAKLSTNRNFRLRERQNVKRHKKT
jgi:hypothetical protein